MMLTLCPPVVDLSLDTLQLLSDSPEVQPTMLKEPGLLAALDRVIAVGSTDEQRSRATLIKNNLRSTASRPGAGTPSGPGKQAGPGMSASSPALNASTSSSSAAASSASSSFSTTAASSGEEALPHGAPGTSSSRTSYFTNYTGAGESGHVFSTGIGGASRGAGIRPGGMSGIINKTSLMDRGAGGGFGGAGFNGMESGHSTFGGAGLNRPGGGIPGAGPSVFSASFKAARSYTLHMESLVDPAMRGLVEKALVSVRGIISFTVDPRTCRITVRARSDFPLEALFACILTIEVDNPSLLNVQQVVRAADGTETLVEPDCPKDDEGPYVPGYFDDDDYDNETKAKSAVSHQNVSQGGAGGDGLLSSIGSFITNFWG
ncbi:hypothetical protein H696_02491 [Fonticula alba]|uniref:Uncharacterized protein n=1 Tax=Fonticula alba TaxID=691883 RepID=A0A058ZC79_FONAL|nr:hypothetical protein H696_02491 [Fonticula alba]KCV71551.1 hypothetical protein H696_02491 [Fonticula alba]|eukprot:XP_009494674.1 hypothetical protein H696_02491 [Fonticula alba]